MTARPTRPRRKPALVLIAGAAILALTGCGTGTPGAAAVVGDSTISTQRVDEVATALCSANLASAEASGQQTQQLAMRSAREGALRVLLDSEISRQFGESEDVEPDERLVSQAVSQNQQSIDALPEDEQDAFRAALEDYAGGQSVLVEAGRASLEESGQENVADEAALAEGQRLLAEFVETVDVEVDPRFGTFAEGALQPGGAELSVATSDAALAASSAEPSSEWVGTLPPSQLCG